MRLSRFGLLSLIGVTAWTVACADTEITNPNAAPEAQPSQQADPADVIPGQYIIVFKDAVSAPVDLAQRLATQYDLRLRHTYQHAIKGFSAVVPEGAVEALERHPLVDYVEPNQRMYIEAHPVLEARRAAAWRALSLARTWDPMELLGSPFGTDLRLNPPTNLSATTVSTSGIDLTWTDNSNGETGYFVERRTGQTGTFARVATLGSNAISYGDRGLSADTEYCYRTQAYKDKGRNREVTAYSNIDCATTDQDQPPTPPNAPSNLEASAVAHDQIDLTWTDNSGDEDGFRIERCVGAGCTGFAQIAETGPNVTSYTDNTVAGSTTYRYRTLAFNAAGSSAYSNVAEATTPATPPPPTPPAAPSDLVATTVSSSRIDLSWTDNSTDEDGFRIERCTGAGCTAFAEVATVGADVTGYSDTGLAASTTYRYQVLAFNDGGDSDPSNIAEATTEEGATACSDTGNHDDLTDPGLWGIVQVKADLNPKWQATQTAGCEITVWFFSIDTGVDSDHPDLNVAEIMNFVSSEPGHSGEDGNGHGTHTSGTAAAIDGNGGVVGVAPGAPVYGFRVLDDGGSGTTDDVIAGVDEVTARRNANPSQPMVANMSLGGGASDALDSAVRRSVNAGVAYSISAGNGVFGACFFPGDAANASPARVGDDDINSTGGSNGNTRRVNGALTTTSSNQSDSDANCNFGNAVTVAAPGVSVKSTWLNGGYNTISGTSMAAPHVGGAALLELQDNRSATPAQVEQAIMDDLDPWTTDDLPNADGRLDAATL